MIPVVPTTLAMLDYNTRVVLAGTVLLGICGGVVGTLVLLRKRALIGDVASHAALPGVGLAYLCIERWSPGEGRWFPGLLLGASCTAGLGVACSQAIQRIRRMHEDVAMAITLSLFFGVGVVLFTMIQGLATGQSAGLSEFVFGKAAILLAADVWLLAGAAVLVLFVCALLHKEMLLLCFDGEYARAGGWPVQGLDAVLTGLVIVVTVLGMQSVGLLLVVALLVLPSSAAQFWAVRLASMQVIAGVCGGLAAGAGVLLSATFPKLAAGAVIVLMAAVIFALSFLLGTRRGLVWEWRDARKLRQQIGRDDLLRAYYEVLEPQLTPASTSEVLSELSLTRADLLTARQWSEGRLAQLLNEALRGAWLRYDAEGRLRLTSQGRREAIRAVRNHRLWELYLLEHRAATPANVDRSADSVEHHLPPEAIEELETLWQTTHPQFSVPGNPHPIPLSSESQQNKE